MFIKKQATINGDVLDYTNDLEDRIEQGFEGQGRKINNIYYILTTVLPPNGTSTGWIIPDEFKEAFVVSLKHQNANDVWVQGVASTDIEYGIRASVSNNILTVRNNVSWANGKGVRVLIMKFT